MNSLPKQLLDTDSLRNKALEIYFKNAKVQKTKDTINTANAYVKMMTDFHLSVLDSIKYIPNIQEGSLAQITIGCNVLTHRGDYGEVIKWQNDLLYRVIHPNGIISLYNEEDLTVVSKKEYVNSLVK